jgi:hypothetical protein
MEYDDGVEFEIDWTKYPKLRGVLENRPTQNVYWQELFALVREAVEADRKTRVAELDTLRRRAETAEVRRDDVLRCLGENLGILSRALSTSEAKRRGLRDALTKIREDYDLERLDQELIDEALEDDRQHTVRPATLPTGWITDYEDAKMLRYVRHNEGDLIDTFVEIYTDGSDTFCVDDPHDDMTVTELIAILLYYASSRA